MEFELGAEVPRDRPLWLVANGWIYPTDSSINVAIGQGQHATPRGLALEAQDEAGRWVVVAPDLGFPAGKNKTILIDLSTRRARRRRTARGGCGCGRISRCTGTGWRVAGAVESPALVTTRLQPARAELRYRGFSQTSHDERDLPENAALRSDRQRRPALARSDRLLHALRGRDRAARSRVDDRYVIMNAGDELQLSFAAPPPPAAGWRRDFVLIGDGWEKDGDYNTSFSKTVLPLPSHDRPDYGRGGRDARRSIDDPVYQRHPEDWQTYHTRFVAPRDFLAGPEIAP